MRKSLAWTALSRKWHSPASPLQKLNAAATVHHTAIFWVLGILYKFVLDALYIWAASPTYAYAGLVYAPDTLKYVIAAAMYFSLFAVLPKRENDTVTFLLQLQFVLSVAPMLSFYALSGGSTRYMLMVFAALLLQVWIVCRPAAQRKTIRIVGIQNYMTVALGVLVIFTVIVPILYNGFEGFKAFDLEYIYTIRANATYPPGFGYILNWVPNVILPLGLLLLLKKKQYVWAGACVVCQILLYMETGKKVTLFILVPILTIYLISHTGHMLKLMYLGFVCLCIGVILVYRLDDFGSGDSLGFLLNRMIAVRAIFHPADNKFNFYEFFSRYPKIFFSDGIIGKMFSLTYPYAGSSGQVIFAAEGGEFLSANLNTGYLGEAYAQLGFAGILLMAALLGWILRGLASYDSRENAPVLSALFCIFIIILNDGALFTTLFTTGMLLAFLLTFIYFENRREEASHGIQRL